MSNPKDIVLRELYLKLDKLNVEYDRIGRERECLTGTISIFERDGESDSRVTIDPDRPFREIITETMAWILDEAGEPLHVNEVYERVKAKGIHVSAENPTRSLGHYLSLGAQFKSLGKNNRKMKGKWALVKEDLSDNKPPPIQSEQLAILGKSESQN